jgi:UDP-glucose 4-epimerase
MKVLVTGGAGFIGSHIVDNLIENNHEVVILDNLTSGTVENINKKAAFYQVDMRGDLTQIFTDENIEAVCHAAAKTNMRESITDPEADADINIMGLLNLLKTCAEYGVQKFVFSSTGGALYGDTDIIPTPESEPAQPISPYGISKMAGERYCFFYQKKYGLDVTVLRYSNVYGPRLGRKANVGAAMLKIMQSIDRGENPCVFGDGEQTRDFVYVEDVARANRFAMEKSKGHNIYNIGSGFETSVNDLVQLISKLIGKSTQSDHIPAVTGEVRRSSLNVQKAESEIGWKSDIDLKTGISHLYSHLKL